MEASSYGTVEALANDVASKLLDKKFLKVNIRILKSTVFGQADGPGVFISRINPDVKEDHMTWDTELRLDF
jgi:dihydroneopterin aldolase